MKKRKLVAVLFAAIAATSVYAQRSNVYEEFFLKSLTTEQSEFNESKKVSVKSLDAKRQEIWQHWVQANEKLGEEQLLDLAPISKETRGSWNLPEALEPHAVMPFYYGSKGEKPEEGYPMFLYLHGSGPKEAEWETGLKLAQYFDDAPSVYFVPQIPNEGAYYRWYLRSKQFAWNRLLRQVMLKEYINPNRLYVLGISEGGYGSQRLASFYADYWAAAGPMAGGEPLKNAPVENCGNMAFSFLTGALDKGFYRDILTTYTKEAFDSLAVLYPGAYEHRIELVPGRGHGLDYSPTTPWLKQHHRNPWPKQFVWEDYEMDGWHRKGFYNLVVLQRPDEQLRTRYDMDICDNVVRLTVRDVKYETTQKDPKWGIEMKFHRTYTASEQGTFLIYLDEHLVDLNKEVVVEVNGKQVFKGKLKCDLKHMVNSLAVFYDSERIFPAAVRVEL